MFYWLYDVPTQTMALIITALFVVFYWVGCVLLRPILRQFVRTRSNTNEIVGNIISCFGVFYGLLLGLLAVAAYQNFSEADANVAREAAALSALYEDVSAYREPYGENLRWLVRDYCRYVVKYAWPLQRRGLVPAGGTVRARAIKEKLVSFEPTTAGEQVLHAEALRQFNMFLEYRRLRLYAVTGGIPPVMWYVVAVGAIINLALVWLFDMNLTTQLFLGGLLAFFLGSMIFLITAMDHPFRGEVSIPSDAFQVLLTQALEE